MADPASETFQRRVIAAIDAASSAFEIDVLEIIAERLGKIGDITFSELYSVMPEDAAKIRQAINNGTKQLENVAASVMSDMATANDEWAATYYQASGIPQESVYTHAALNKTLQENTNAVRRKVSALCRSSVVGIGNGSFVPVEQGYRQIVSAAATGMSRTTFKGDKITNLTIDQAVSKAVKRLSSNGLRVQYRSGVTRNLQTAVRTNIMDAYRATMAEMREIQGREFGADGVEVSAHALCAPDHLPFQGQRYPYKPMPNFRYTWDEVQNMPARPLVTGANCGHQIYPVIIGVSSPAYTREELNEINRLSKEQVEFEGLSGQTLTMSRYEASQYQRKMETNIRKMKENTHLLEKAGLKEFAKMERKTQRQLSSRYRNISEQMGLDPRPDLLRIYTTK